MESSVKVGAPAWVQGPLPARKKRLGPTRLGSKRRTSAGFDCIVSRNAIEIRTVVERHRSGAGAKLRVRRHSITAFEKRALHLCRGRVRNGAPEQNTRGRRVNKTAPQWHPDGSRRVNENRGDGLRNRWLRFGRENRVHAGTNPRTRGRNRSSSSYRWAIAVLLSSRSTDTVAEAYWWQFFVGHFFQPLEADATHSGSRGRGWAPVKTAS